MVGSALHDERMRIWNHMRIWNLCADALRGVAEAIVELGKVVAEAWENFIQWVATLTFHPFLGKPPFRPFLGS